MKKLILFLCLLSGAALADTPIKDLRVTNSADMASAAVKVGTLTSPTNGDITISPNGTGKVVITKAFSDVTTGNVSASAHGLQKKLSGNTYDYAGGDGNYSIPSQAPFNTQNAAYTFVIGDAGRVIFHDEATARTYTIPANASVAYPIGTMITIVNNTGGGSITLSITTDTLRRGDGTAGTGNRTITADSIVTIIKTKSGEWMITGKFS